MDELRFSSAKLLFAAIGPAKNLQVSSMLHLMLLGGKEAMSPDNGQCPLSESSNNCSCVQAYAVGADFTGADMTNAVIDRVDFRKANLKDVIFANAVITGGQFEGANLEGALFDGALIGNEDAKRL